MVSLLGLRKRNEANNALIRSGRVIHWSAIFLAVFGLVVSFVGMLEAGDREFLPFLAVGFVWFGVAMVGRGIRYLLSSE